MKVSEIKDAISRFERTRIIGELTVILPEPPKDYKLIANWDKSQAYQKFEHTEQPNRTKEPPDEFLAQEFKRFEEGYWFFNNGNVEWITGCNYFFLNYWTDKGKKLRFIDAQQMVFHWWWHIEQAENLMGGNLVAGRRLGKTVIATCIAYFRSTTNPFHRCGIQSKTNKDGKTVFNKLVRSWRKLPAWLRPNHSGETRPATILEFSEPRKRTAKKEKIIEEEALESSIDFQPSEEDAYDGEELNTVIEDETGKTITVNTDTRWGVLKFCLLDGTDIIGKAFRTSTVEDMEKRGGKNLWITWVASMLKSLDPETNQTESGLVNLFVSADWGLKGRHPITKVPFVDDYGVSNRELATTHILATWNKLTGTKLLASQRKMPLTIKHAFQVSENSGTFDPEIYGYLDLQKEYLDGTSLTGERAPKTLRRTVTFYRDFDGLAKWRDDENGHASFIWDFPRPDMSNARKVGELSQFVPLNTEQFCGGCDPFAATIVSGAGSMGVLYIFRKGDVDDPENSGLVICRYAQRTRTVEDFHKMVMIICQYYGCKVNYEADVPDYYETFVREFFRHYVMWTPKIAIDPTKRNHTPRPGTLSKDPYAFQKQFQVLVEYLYARWHKIYFIELIDQLIEFDVEDRTKSDEVVAFCMSLLAGWESGHRKIKDTRTPAFVKFKNQTSSKRQWLNGGNVDLSQYHVPYDDKKVPF